jgi:hypothetical protein
MASSKFNELSPLKKWVITNKFFIRTKGPKEEKIGSTHFLLDGGIWKIPKNEYEEFLRILSTDLQNNEKHYISENKTEIFKLISDLDFYDSGVIDIVSIINVIQEIINEYFSEKSVIICTADSKKVTINDHEYTKHGFHLVWPKIWTTTEIAKKLRILFIEKLTSSFGPRDPINSWNDVVDLSVYEDNGLRMIGCRKIGFCKSCKNKKDSRENCQPCGGSGKIDEGRVYKPEFVFPENEEYLNFIKTNYFMQVCQTSIYNYLDNPLTELIKELPSNNTIGEVLKKTKKKVIDDRDETTVKVENFIKKNFKEHYSKIKVKKFTKESNERYYAEPDDNFCINVNRTHSSSSVYFQITQTGICQRCFCKKDSVEGRLFGPCTKFSSKEVPLSKVLKNILFGPTEITKKGKKINTFNISRNSSTASLDLGVTPSGHKNIFSNKEICLENCKNILFQLEKELST